MLGRFMTAQLTTSGWRVIPLDHQALDITDPEAVVRTLETNEPEYVINCAATTDVDRCEREPEWAEQVNVKAPMTLARACRNLGASLVHISTDYVFDGRKTGFYTQQDQPNPLSVYGKTKLAGEIAVQEELAASFVIRTSWIFGPGGKNFGSRVLEYAGRGVQLKGVIDQTSIPTYAPDLAARIEEVLELGVSGLYQITNFGPGTWYEFARLVLDLAGLKYVEVEPVERADLRQLAERPRNSAMRCLLSERLQFRPLRDWRHTLPDFVSAATGKLK